ncbi:hypothetical protein Glove_327g25 [Diversispora epigaea]|uniref:Ran-specific GTPase-activating protein 30 n=1 Tax=Diversispora epigaea TaxID=1348612 RepID=A0A397HQJ1_9GLOM|nr:hypothetical protein Glove_327g25 [Diversispora epigaea]
MDEIFTKLALHTVTLVGKAAFAYSTTYAMKQVTNYIKNDASNVTKAEMAELEQVKETLEHSIQMVQPAIDLIEIISARGNTALEPTASHTTRLRKEIESFARKFSTETEDTTTTKKGSLDLSKVIKEMQGLIQKIEKFVPYLNLIMTTSGANLGWSLPNSVSPSRLLQASNSLCEANRRFMQNNVKEMRVGPLYKLKLYYMFTASVRPKSVVDFTWKEEFTKCDAAIHRVRDISNKKEYLYELVLIEDLNDGRYHEEFEKSPSIRAKIGKPNQSIPGKCFRIPVAEISRLYYTSSGSLLNIEESKTPVLVLKVIKGLSKARERNKDNVDLEENPFYPIPDVPDKPIKESKEHLDVDLYALEIFQEAETFNKDDDDEISSDDEIDSDNEIDNNSTIHTPKKIPLPETPPSKSVSSTPPRNRNISTPVSPSPKRIPLPDDEGSDATVSDDDEEPISDTYDKPNNEITENLPNAEGSIESDDISVMRQFNLKTLSLLEYLLRLSALEVCEQMSHLEIADEKINLFLKDDDSSGGSTSTVTTTESPPTSKTSKPSGKEELNSNTISLTNKFLMLNLEDAK